MKTVNYCDIVNFYLNLEMEKIFVSELMTILKMCNFIQDRILLALAFRLLMNGNNFRVAFRVVFAALTML